MHFFPLLDPLSFLCSLRGRRMVPIRFRQAKEVKQTNAPLETDGGGESLVDRRVLPHVSLQYNLWTREIIGHQSSQ